MARIGPTPLPKSEIVHWKMPLFMPRRFGWDASTATATPVGATAPSATPMMPRMSIRLRNPVATPLSTDSRENNTTAGTSTRRRPRRSDKLPTKMADTPQHTPSTPTREPSC